MSLHWLILELGVASITVFVGLILVAYQLRGISDAIREHAEAVREKKP